MRLTCSQSGGQQLGTLSLELALLSKADTDQYEPIDPIIPKGETAAASEINMGGITEISFDFEKTYGVLPAGDYALDFQIADRYDKNALSALTRKYHDTQWYSVAFTIK